MSHARSLLCVTFAVLIAGPAVGSAQSRKVRVVSTDGNPIVYANVVVEGGITQITDEKGEVSLGAGKRQTLSVNVRRIGYASWFGKLELPDTAATMIVTLAYTPQALGEVRVIGQKTPTLPFVQPFYDRWSMRQKGLLSATFIGPEELEFRHPSKITNMLNGLNGVQIRRSSRGDAVAWSTETNCTMAIVIDGHQQYPEKFTTRRGMETYVPIDQILNANDIMGIEVYSRGGNMPISLQVNDTACGVIAFWTGSRR